MTIKEESCNCAPEDIAIAESLKNEAKMPQFKITELKNYSRDICESKKTPMCVDYMKEFDDIEY